MQFRSLLLLVLVSLACGDEVQDLRVIITKYADTCLMRSRNGDTLHIDYVGKFEDGTVFDTSYSRGRPYVFTIGRGEVIKGVDMGLLSMCENEERHLVIPAHLAYGEHGYPPTIPGGATIIFDYKLTKLERHEDL